MAKPELGTKRVDPETGRKFYDLNKDPIVSPFTGKEYPLSFFEAIKATPARGRAAAPRVEEEAETENTEVADTDEETVSINDIDEDDDSGKDDLPDVDGDDDDGIVVDDDGDDDSTFLEDDEDEDDDMTDIIGGGRDDEDDV